MTITLKNKNKLFVILFFLVLFGCRGCHEQNSFQKESNKFTSIGINTEDVLYRNGAMQFLFKQDHYLIQVTSSSKKQNYEFQVNHCVSKSKKYGSNLNKVLQCLPTLKKKKNAKNSLVIFESKTLPEHFQHKHQNSRFHENEMKADFRIISQWFEVEANSNKLKSNLNFTNLQDLKNFKLIYTYDKGLKVRADKKTQNLQFYDPKTQEIILEESRPLIYNSLGHKCWGKYILEQTTNNRNNNNNNKKNDNDNDNHNNNNNKNKSNFNNKKDHNKVIISYHIPKKYLQESLLNGSQWINIDPRFATYIGGDDRDWGMSTKYDSKGDLYITGYTQSTNFPIVGNKVYRSTFTGGLKNSVLVKVKNESDLEWSTFLVMMGDVKKYWAPLLIVDPFDDAPIISGVTLSYEDCPTTENAWQRDVDCTNVTSSQEVGYILKLNTNGQTLNFSTLICGDGAYLRLYSAFIDENEDEEDYGIYFIGHSDLRTFPGYDYSDENYKCPYIAEGDNRIIIGKLSKNAGKLLMTNCFGGSESDRTFMRSIYVQNGLISFAGWVESADFPMTTGTLQETKPSSIYKTTNLIGSVNATTFELRWATYLGGSTSSYPCTIIMEKETNNIWVAGATYSVDFPTTEDALEKKNFNDENTRDGYFSKISMDGKSLLYSSYLGSTGNAFDIYEIVHDPKNDHILLCGEGTFDPEFEFDYDYGNTSFAFILDSGYNQLIRKISFGGGIYSCDTNRNKGAIDYFAVVGSAGYDSFITSETHVYQEENDGQIDFVFSSSHDLCGEGYYFKDLYFGECHECPAGTFSNLSNANSSALCKPCPVGHYQPETHSTSCNMCALGTFQTQENSTFCYPCINGTYQDAEGQTSCTQCPAGTFNPYQFKTSLDDCQKCPRGYYGDKEGMTSSYDSCTKCHLGTYNNIEGASNQSYCRNCTMGYYNPIEGSISEHECQSCGKGFYSQTEGITSSHDCIPCPELQISSSNAATACSYCGVGYEPNEQKTECVKCKKGHYKNETDSGCEPCAVNTFNNDEGSTFCHKCGIPGICLGGDKCDSNRDPDTYCSQCKEGYYLKNAKCSKCGANWIWSIWLAAFIIVIILALRYKNKIQKLFLLKQNPIFEIYFTFFQLLAAILSLNIDLPFYLNNGLTTSTMLFNIDISIIIKPDCFNDFDFFSKYLLIVLLPICLLALGLVVLVFLFLYSRFIKKVNLKPIRTKYWYYISLGFRYIYIPETIICTQPFQTTFQHYSKKSTLNYFPNISTKDERYKAMYPWFVFFLIFYSFLTPVLLIIILVISKLHDLNDYWYDRFGWLWQFYRPKRFWWELIKIFYKFFIVCSPIFFINLTTSYLLVIILLVVLFINILIVAFKPYPIYTPLLNPSNNDLEDTQNVQSQSNNKRKSFWLKISAEDFLSIGLNFILFSVISAGLNQFNHQLFLLFYPIGAIISFVGTKKNIYQILEKNRLKKQFKKERDNQENNNAMISSTSSSTTSSSASNSPSYRDNGNEKENLQEKDQDQDNNDAKDTRDTSDTSDNSDNNSNSLSSHNNSNNKNILNNKKIDADSDSDIELSEIEK
ncbi:cell surface glycoprotein (s-layer protein)-like protein [Anaeramoeba flamelloides]|uniref:Cell surface glycoprotein (S-layer protein)-like protein n=1 Tax=Anaeramoeba flamelloides TaxID=1746091 RepID=A0ABQ8XXZ2_9EUKA|nr:cell surface glycoprotein (s-layer protein)-like protein [Anaeramoeba flamelloides]